MVLECLEGLVGVTDADCDCYPQGEEWTEATSGLYLSQLMDLSAILASGGCGQSDLHTIGTTSITEAIQGLPNNLLQCWAQNKQYTPRGLFDELVSKGTASNTSTAASVSGYRGLRFKLRPIRHGRFIIRDFHTLFTDTGTITVSIYDDHGLVMTRTLDTQANTLKRNTLASPIEIDFYDSGVFRGHLYVVSNEGTPALNKTMCLGCNPSFKQRIEKWAVLDGFKVADIADRDDCKKSFDYAYGLVPKVRFECAAAQSICDGGMTIGSDPNAGTIAEYIWYMGAAKAYSKILAKSDISRYNTLSSEDVDGEIKKFTAEALARMGALCNTTMPTDGGCFICKELMSSQTLRS